MTADVSAHDLPPLVAVTGPTASGKSALALQLAKVLDTEIISADSVQVYRGFDIGSAKPTQIELAEVKHHLISELDPAEPFDAGIFRKAALGIANDLRARNKLPLVCGGTGLYLSALLGGLIDVETSPEAEEEVDAEIERLTARGLDSAVISGHLSARLGPDAGELRDPQRLRRALIVKLSTGKSIAELKAAQAHSERNFRALIFCILPERVELYARLDQRVDAMVANGLIEEVRSLRLLHASECKPFRSIGYRHVCALLDGTIEEAEMIELFKRDTRRFAKRQITWWRHQPRALAWQPVAESFSTDVKANLPAFVTARLASKIKEFVEKRGEFDSNTIFFCPLAI